MQERFDQAKEGDYFIYQMDKQATLLNILKIEDNKIFIEELSIPEFMDSISSYKEWYERGANTETRWSILEIDKTSFKTIKSFSKTKNTWEDVFENDQILTKLLSLDLEKIKDNERKKVGHLIREHGTDLRPLWHPPHFIEGKRVESKSEAFTLTWPDDDTPLSSKKLTLYVTQHELGYMPTFIETASLGKPLKMRLVDSGRGLQSHFKELPKLPLSLMAFTYSSQKDLVFSIKNPSQLEISSVIAYPNSDAFSLSSLEFNATTDSDVTIITVPYRALKDLEGKLFYFNFIPFGYNELTIQTPKPIKAYVQ